MSFRADGCALHVALVLAATAAVMSSARNNGEAFQKLQWLLLTGLAPEADADAGAVGASSHVPVSP